MLIASNALKTTYRMTPEQHIWVENKRRQLKKRGRDVSDDVVGRALFSWDGFRVGIITCCSVKGNLFVSWFGGSRNRVPRSLCKFDPNSKNWKVRHAPENQILDRLPR